MIVEQDRVKEARERYLQEKAFLKKVIAKSEVYERLASNKDFIEFQNDIQDIVKAHDLNVQHYVGQIGSVANTFKKLRLADAIAHHQIHKDAAQNIHDMVLRVIAAKESTMERINEIEKLEKEIEQ